MNEKLAILGSGPAGCAAAIYAARAGLSPVILEGNLPGGLLTQTRRVENYPGFPQGTDGFELVDAMRSQAEHFGSRTLECAATRLEFAPRQNRLTLDEGEDIVAEAVVLALGTRHRLGLPDEKAYLGKGLSYCARCDGAFFRGQPVVVIGGGDMAVEEALSLTTFASEIHLVFRSGTLAATQILVDRAVAEPKITLHAHALPETIVPDADGRVAALAIRSLDDGGRLTLEAKGIFVAVGVLPNTEILEGTGLALDSQGYIKLVDGSRSLTALPGVFAAGDCADPTYRQAIVAAAMGAKAGMDAVKFLTEKTT
ncbi:MAG: FAD-dependent oxidoreductase [Victivallales bacterium]|nr:FAD-dependent oxidoreductase [Victivallales bacterium]